jgi:arylsulfatase A-like enzyme
MSALTAVATAVTVALASSTAKPNFLFIVSDDQGFSNIGYHNSTVLSPRIDELAMQGIKLENYYVSPVCSPTRSALMTGRYTNRLGTQATVIRSDVPFGVPLDNTFVAQNLQDAGYHTALFGKWCVAARSHAASDPLLPPALASPSCRHLGFYQREYTPLARGFDEHLGYFEGTVNYTSHVGGGYGGTKAGVDWHRGNQSVCFEDDGKWVEDLLVPQAVDFFGRMAAPATNPGNKPWFLYLPFHLIHGPNMVPEKFMDLYPKLDPLKPAADYGMCGVCECALRQDGGFHQNDVSWGACRTVLGMVSALDWAVGATLDGLKAAGQYDNTIVFFTSDNGAQPGQGGTNFPLRGWKTSMYEGGVRVPAWVHSPLLPAAARGSTHRGR